jgi:sugar phosphate permease
MLGLAAFAQVVTSSLQIGIGFLLPFVRDDLGISTAEAALMLSFFSTGIMLMAFPAGSATDRVGERTVLTIGLTAAGLFTVLAAVQSHYLLAAALVGLAGLGAAPTHPAGSRLVLRLFPPRERGMAIGARQTAVPMGGLVVAALVAPLTTAISWRAGLASTGVCILVAAMMVALFLVDPGPRKASTSKGLRADALALVRNRNFMLANLAAVLMNIAQVSVTSFLSLFILQELDDGAAVAAIALAVVNVTAGIGRIVSGHVSDQLFGGLRAKLLLLVQAGALVAALWLAAMPGGYVPLLIACCALVGCTIVGWNALGVALVAESAGYERAGGAAGLSTTSVYTITMLVPPLFGMLIDALGSVRYVWLASAVGLVLAALTTTQVREARR